MCVCRHCGVSFKKSANSKVKGIFCSRFCCFKYRAEYANSPKRQQEREERRKLKAVKRAEKRVERDKQRDEKRRSAASQREAERLEHIARIAKPRECQRCGRVFHPVSTIGRGGRHRVKFCSTRCSLRAHKKRLRGRKHSSRARRYGVPRDYSIGAEKVYARDGWVCRLCGGRVSKRLYGTNDNHAPAIDHIVPLSVPGSPGHIWSNVQCSHRICNSVKSARVVGQLRIF